MLKIEVIKFEAQDVITASTAAPVECICAGNEDMNRHQETGDHSPCPATEHPNCKPVN